MKTFLTSLLLMVLVVTFAAMNTVIVTRKTDELLAIADRFPTDAEQFEAVKESIAADVSAFNELWNSALPFLAYTANYENLNRADEAAILLYASYQNHCAADFVAARYDFIDALRRLRSLQTISFSSIF